MVTGDPHDPHNIFFLAAGLAFLGLVIAVLKLLEYYLSKVTGVDLSATSEDQGYDYPDPRRLR
jgi:hypothetical protein